MPGASNEAHAESRAPTSCQLKCAEAFVRTIAAREAYRLAMASDPAWQREANAIMDVLRGRRETKSFAVWKHGSNQLCGYGVWTGQPVRRTGRYSDFDRNENDFRVAFSAHGTPNTTSLAVLINEIFRWVDTPVPVSTLIKWVASLRGVSRLPPLSLDALLDPGDGAGAGAPREKPENSREYDPQTQLLFKDLLGTISKFLASEPRHKFGSFFLNLAAVVAEQLLSATGDFEKMLQRYASILQIGTDRLKRMVGLGGASRGTDDELPMDDRGISKFISIEEPRVRYLRWDVRKRLIRHLGNGSAE